MRLAFGRPRGALIFAPHPDDEIIGAAGLIHLLALKGTAVRVVVVTDGAASHPTSRTWPRRRLVAARRAESRRALQRLGIAAGSVRFLGLADGDIRTEDCRRALAAELRRMPRLDLIVSPAPDDEHPDHRAVAGALRTIPSPARRLTYRVWPPSPPRHGRSLTLPVTSFAKRSLIGLYRTQLGIIHDDPDGFTMARHEVDAFSRPLECYWESR